MVFMRNILGAVIFTAAVLVFINVIGNILVGSSKQIEEDGHTVILAKPEAPVHVYGRVAQKFVRATGIAGTGSG